MIRGAEAPVHIVTCPSRQVLTLIMRVPRPPVSPGARRLVLTLLTVDRQKYTDKFRNVVLVKDGDQLYRS
jgi:hypothetical protein